MSQDKLGIKDPELRAERVIEEMTDAQLAGPASKTRRDFFKAAGVSAAAMALPASVATLLSERPAHADPVNDIKALANAYALEKLAINTYIVAAGLKDNTLITPKLYVADDNYATIQGGNADPNVKNIPTPYRTLVFAIANDHVQHAATFKFVLDSMAPGSSAQVDTAVMGKSLPLPKTGGTYELRSGLATLTGFARIATYALAAEIEAANSYLALLNGTSGLLNSGNVAASGLGAKNSVDISGPGSAAAPYRLTEPNVIKVFAEIAPVEIQHAALYRAAFALLVGVDIPGNPAAKLRQVVPYNLLSQESTTDIGGGVRVTSLFATVLA